jgi:hypothetical protein
MNTRKHIYVINNYLQVIHPHCVVTFIKPTHTLPNTTYILIKFNKTGTCFSQSESALSDCKLTFPCLFINLRSQANNLQLLVNFLCADVQPEDGRLL